ncbi:AMP-binding protein [Pantoea ananatis]|uniref:AMP-binding protein n=1 Tax=Pantoea ananas TaxID=553 RepID=UPI0013037FA9|nr:AMP-binding protein [Pantoea ananatis]
MNSTFIEKFESIAALFPANIALISGHRSITYSQLQYQAKRVAAGIQAEIDDDVEGVVLCLRRDESLIVTILACHYLGMPYIPVDPRTTYNKIEHILSQARYLYISNVKITECQKTIDVIGLLNTSAPFEYKNFIHASQEAYRIYTSGSTGAPKAVMVSHIGCANLIEYFCHLLAFKPGQTWLSSTSIAFDIFFLEYSVPLVSGGTLILLTDQEIYSPQQIAAQVIRWSPSVYQATPSLFKGLLGYLEQGWHFQKVLVGGEALSPQLSSALFARSDWLCNVYGPTETTVWSGAHVIRQAGDTRIGQAIRNTEILILNEHQQECAQGEPGRIYISGDGLAMGYFNNPELTASKFTELCIRGVNQRMYDTNDIGYVDNEGIVNFLHREGGFIKINGYRVEPTEITDTFEAIAGVSGSAVICLHDDLSDSSKLIGWVECTEVTEAAIRAFLQSKLNYYLIPHHIFTIPALPYTLSGKVDGNRLEEMSRTLLSQVPTASGSSSVGEPSALASHPAGKILGQYIDITRMSKDDNFFELGLTSMQAISLHLDMLELYPNLQLHEIFERPCFDKLINELECI